MKVVASGPGSEGMAGSPPTIKHVFRGHVRFQCSMCSIVTPPEFLSSSSSVKTIGELRTSTHEAMTLNTVIFYTGVFSIQ